MKHNLKLTLLAVALVACQGGATPSTTLSTPTTSPIASTTTVPEGLITTVEDLPLATIQIVSTGTFVTPDFGTFEGGGSGSGFIIDPSGISVSNSHVVSGAGLLDVHIGGSAETVNAQILGVSECNDLAVIDLDGEGYNYLEWYDGDIFAGLEVQAAGYPLGEPEFALTQGIISKADAPGETEWASIDAILEHDARI
ncbi:MAG TPA: serine protease, partial [Acidimicrobiia bacterium]|nr:serine protease [Acidimicrobiia bacterium]